MTSTKPTVRRLLGGGVLCAVFGALTVVTAAPVSASPLVWGNSQAWVSDGDAVSGYSTAISHGEAQEEESEAGEVSGPLAEYAEINGSSYALVDDDGVHAVSVVDSAAFRLEVDDLVDLGMIDVPGPEEGGEGDRSGTEDDEPSPLEEQTAPEENDEPAGETEPQAEADGPGTSPSPEPPPRPQDDEEETDEGDGDPQGQKPSEPEGSPEPEEAPEPEETPEVRATESPVRGDTRLMPLEPVADPGAGGTDSVEFTVADVRATVRAEYGGRVRTGFEYGEITAFGEPVDELGRGSEGTTVTDVLEVPGTEGGPGEKIPVSVHFAANESKFEDEDPEWEGTGARSWLTAWVQVGAPEEDHGFVVELADSWALGSTHVSESGPSPAEDEDGEAAVEGNPVSRLPTTGGSLAALVTAACVAVGGGCAATYLARGRTTAMDDRIED